MYFGCVGVYCVYTYMYVGIYLCVFVYAGVYAYMYVYIFICVYAFVFIGEGNVIPLQ